MTYDNLTIRPAVIEDAKAILDIYSYYVENTAITFEYNTPSLSEFEQRIKNTLAKYPYLVALDDDEILGYCYASPFKQRAAYDWAVETSIYIKNDSKRKGIGKALYTALEIYLQKMNIVNMNACITFPQFEDKYLTKNSFYFHQKMGFTLVGQFTKCGYKFNKWYNMIWMEKLIGVHNEEQPPVILFKDIL